MPDAHARLSPSSAERWLSCPGSRRLIEGLPPGERNRESVYADEGTMAHRAAELRAAEVLDLMPQHEIVAKRQIWLADVLLAGFDADEMMMHASGWAAMLLARRAAGKTVHLERRVATGVPQCWGTADAVSHDAVRIDVDDYKYGKGVRVFAQGNPQIKLYGLGSVDRFAPDAKTVTMSIHQPRLDHVSSVTMEVDELREWRSAVAIPGAMLALTNDAPIVPSEEACRFCPVAGVCKTRADAFLRQDFGDPDILTDLQLSELMSGMDNLESWASAVRSAAFQQAKMPSGLPGWKIVRKRGQRKINNPQAVIELLGPDSTRVSLKTLADLEKMVGGKAALDNRLGDLLQIAEGSEVLVPNEDPRPAADPGADFA